MAQVGFLIPAYNAENFIKQALDSVLSQTFADFNVYIIDDGSTDRTVEIIKSYPDTRIKLIEKKQNSGISETLNMGLDAITEPYIARLDADDVCMPDRLEEQVGFMNENPEVIVCGTQVAYFGNQQGTSQLSLYDDLLKTELLFGSCFIHPTVMIRNEVLKKTGLKYPVGFSHLEDFAFWRTLSPYGKFANMPQVLLQYRLAGQNISVENFATKVERLRGLFSEILKENGIVPHAENMRLHIELAGLAKVKHPRELVKYAHQLAKQVSENRNVPFKTVKQVMNNRLRLLFFKETDASRSFAWKYWRARKKIHGVEFRYYLGSLLGRKSSGIYGQDQK